MTSIPTAVRRFVADHISSLERLEVLLLLANAPERAWTVADIEKHLRTTRGSIRQHLTQLATEGFVSSAGETPEAFRYGASGEHDDLVHKLAHYYRLRRVTTIELIYSQHRSSDRNVGAERS